MYTLVSTITILRMILNAVREHSIYSGRAGFTGFIACFSRRLIKGVGCHKNVRRKTLCLSNTLSFAVKIYPKRQVLSLCIGCISYELGMLHPISTINVFLYITCTYYLGVTGFLIDF